MLIDDLTWINSLRSTHQRIQSKHNQSGRSPKVVRLFSATNFSSYIIELLQLHDTIQSKWNYARIHYNIAIRVTLSYSKIRKISFLVPNLVAFSCYAGNIHLEKCLMKCDTKRAIRWHLCNKHTSTLASYTWVPSFARCRLTNNSRKTKRFSPFSEINVTKFGSKN